MAAILFSFRQFWEEFFSQSSDVPQGNVLKDYSVPVIAMMQLVKFPLIGVPRLAMIVAIATFLVDVAALYLVAGGLSGFIDNGRNRSQPPEEATALAGFSLTPVWLVEPFFFIEGWNWLFAALSICYAFLICRSGLVVLAGRTMRPGRSAMRNSALLLVTVSTAVFFVERALLRLFNGLPI